MNDEFIDARIGEEESEHSREGCTCYNGLHDKHRIDCDCPVHCKD